MPNIVDGLIKMDKEQLVNQLSSLEEVTVSNVMSEMGQKAKLGAVKVFNSLRKLVNSDTVAVPKVVTMDERIRMKKVLLDDLHKDDLLERTQKVLLEKVNSASMTQISGESEDELSVMVIDLASKCFKKEIADNLTPAQKADAIYHRYNERLIAQTQKKYEEASDIQKKEIDSNLQKEIDAMSEEQRSELQKALGVEKITGEVVGKLIKSSVGASTLLLAFEASGFGAYMALTTIMHAIFTTTLGITLPFGVYTASTSILSFLMGPGGWLLFAGVETYLITKNKNKIIYELLAQVVWASVMHCGGRFTVREEALPSWLPNEQRTAAMNESAELIDMVKKNDELNSDYEKLLVSLNDKNENIVRKEKQLKELLELIQEKEEKEISAKNESDKLKQEFQEANELLIEQQAKLDALSDVTEISPELQEAYEKAEMKYKKALNRLDANKKLIDNLNQSVRDLSDEVIQYEDILEQNRLDKIKLEDENVTQEEKIKELEDKLSILVDKERNKLEQRWEKAYKRFTFDTGVLKSVVKLYQYNEFGDIENSLMELHEAKDPAALRSNRGKMTGTGEYHLGFTSNSGFPSRIFYKQEKNQDNGKTIIITKICKHNDSRYGK